MTTLSTNDHPILRAQAMALMHKFLSNSKSNNPPEPDDRFDPDSDPYSSDLFRMYEFKVRKCTRSRNHDWTDCPFAHPGEKARRRDPRRFRYSATVCPEYRRLGSCSQADHCEFAHGVFECWLHPSRYRTEACKDGKYCKRKVCFFAHAPRELRLLPAHENGEETEYCGSNLDRNSHPQHCCRHCCTLSPTSTLVGMSHFSPPMSPSLSPPQSPIKAVNRSGFLPLSRYSDRVPSCGPSHDSLGLNSKGVSYEDMVIAEILGSLEGLKMGSPNKRSGGLWVDIGYDNAGAIGDKQSSLSPSTPIDPSTLSLCNTVTTLDDKGNGNGLSGPDLGWVNDLLM